MTTWNVVDVGLPSGATLSVAFACTPNGTEIVGSTDFAGDGNPIAFSWTSGGGFVNIGVLSGGSTSQASGISADASIIVGFGDEGSLPLGNVEGWLYTSGSFTTLGFLPGGNASQANAISADGSTIVGASSTAPFTGGFSIPNPFKYTSGTMTQLGILAGDDQGSAWAVNQDGSVIVGESINSVTAIHTPVMWLGSITAVPIPLATGETHGTALAVNADGSVIVGTMNGTDSIPHAFMYTTASGNSVLIGDPFTQNSSEARGVSGDGLTLVGSGSGVPGAAGLAWIWTLAGGFEDLPPLSGDSNCICNAISSDGTRPIGFSSFPVHATYWIPAVTLTVAFDSLVRKTLASTGSFACGPIPLFPTLPQGFPVKISPVMDTTIGTMKSLREMRVAQRLYPLWDFEIPFAELRDQTQNQTPYAPFTSFKEYEHLVQLWLAMYGQTGVFAFDAPWDNSRSGQPIGAGNGVQTAFTIVRVWGLGSAAVVAPIGMINQIFLVQINGVTVSPSGYSVGRNTIYFNTPPGNGLVITLAFSYYYLCRFVEDEQDFEEFSKNRWTVPSLKFRAVFWV